MKAIKFLSVFCVATLLLTGCGGGGSSSSGTGAGDPGALDPGSSGLGVTQVDDGTGTLVTANFVAAVDINDNLDVVGYAAVTTGSQFAASLWAVDASGTPTMTPSTLDPLVADGFTAAFAVDETGRAVGQADNGSRLVAVIWDNAGLPIALPQLADTGNAAAYAISADGSLVAGTAVNATGQTRAVLWTADSNGDFVAAPAVLGVTLFTRNIDDVLIPSPFSAANGVARVGADEILIVGEAEAGDGTLHAALWRSTDGGATFTPVDLGADHIAYAVNSARQIAGENDTALAPVSWSVNEQGVPSAPVSLAASGNAVAINDNGRIAGWSSDNATVWDGQTPTTLFETTSQAYGLNNDAQPLVVGRNGSQGFVKRIN